MERDKNKKPKAPDYKPYPSEDDIYNQNKEIPLDENGDPDSEESTEDFDDDDFEDDYLDVDFEIEDDDTDVEEVPLEDLHS